MTVNAVFQPRTRNCCRVVRASNYNRMTRFSLSLSLSLSSPIFFSFLSLIKNAARFPMRPATVKGPYRERKRIYENQLRLSINHRTRSPRSLSRCFIGNFSAALKLKLIEEKQVLRWVLVNVNRMLFFITCRKRHIKT